MTEPASEPEPTHCKTGHLYRPGTWRTVSYQMQDGTTRSMRTCLICLERAKRKAAKRPPPRIPRKCTDPVNRPRRDMQERVNAIHLEILHALDGMETRSRADQAAWKIREAELTREADQLTAKLDASRIAAGNRKRVAQ